MADRPEIESPSAGNERRIVPSFSDLVVLAPARGDNRAWRIEQIPPWVAQWAGKTPRDLEGQPITSVSGEIMEALASVADDVFGDGAPIEDYCVEFNDVSGQSLAVRISAQRVDDYRPPPTGPAADRAAESGPAVLIRLQDITESVRLRRRALGVGAFHGIVGRSRPMVEVFYKIEVYGPTEAPVVISGETGTGKELVARALHERSGRRDKPFVAVNCTALSEELFESELFGHERGAFTGAVRSHKGRFERADKGTLFLDEIGDMPVPIQSKLLRVLEQGMFERVGAEHEQRVDVRILAATNMSLERAVAAQRFRADLYHRLVVLRIHVPALRDRPGDLPLLVEYFLNILNERYGRRGVRLTPDATRLLGEYPWPGNVRELRNVLERVYVETPGQVIGRNAFNEWIRERDYLSVGGWNLEHLEVQRASAPVIIPPDPSGTPGSGFRAPSLPSMPGPSYPLARPQEPFVPGGQAIDAVYSVTQPASRKPRPLTADDIRRAFAEANGNATQAARSLGVHKATLYRHMKALGWKREDLEGPPRDGEPQP